MSVPNQRRVYICKPKYTENFLQIGIYEWQEARRVMTYTEFTLFLYLAGNRDGYCLELSQVAVKNATGMGKTSYYDAVNKLIKLGYLVEKHSNYYEFHTTPVRANGNNFFGQYGGKDYPSPRTPYTEESDTYYRPTNREIDNIDKKDNKINNAVLPSANERKTKKSIWEILEERDSAIPISRA